MARSTNLPWLQNNNVDGPMKKLRAGQRFMRKLGFRWWALVLFCPLLTPLQASEVRYDLDIEASSAERALKRLGRQTNHSIIFQSDQVSSVKLNTLDGTYTLENALNSLFHGTHLSYSLTDSGVITITRREESMILTGENSMAKETQTRANTARRTLGAMLATILGVGAPGLAAQDSDVEDVGSNFRIIEEIVVTATRRETNIQETALSIDTFEGDMLEKSGYTSASQFLDAVPGVTAIDSGPVSNRVIIRNIATSTQEAGSPTSATYFDDFAVSGFVASAAEIRLVDMDRVEVLKGPQGTLFGRSAMGGIIRYISNKPDTEELSGGVNAYYSNTADGGDNVGGHGYVNVPIGDSLAIRATAYSYQNDGYIDNVELGVDDFNDDDTVGGRIAVRWMPTDALTFDLTYLNQDIEAAYSWVTTLHSPDGDIPYDAQRRDQVAGVLNEANNAHEILNLAVNYNFDSFTATFLATRSEETFGFVFDQREFVAISSGCICDYPDSGDSREGDADIFELRLISAGVGPFDWILGAYSESSQDSGQQKIRYLGKPTLLLGFIPIDDGLVLTDAAFDRTGDEFALYGEVGYAFTEATHLTLGYRRSDVEFSHVSTKEDGFVAPLTGADLLVGVKFETQEDIDTYKVSLQHVINDDLFAYFTATSGYRRGGFNLPTINSAFSTYDSDSLWSYEVGLKSTWLDGRLVANASVYFLDWSDVQLVVQDPEVFVRSTQNAGKAEIPGFEFSLAYLISEGFDVSFSGSVSKPELQEDVPGGISGKKGDGLPGSAEENFAVNLNWSQPLNNGLGLYGYAAYKYVGPRLNDFNRDLDVELDSYQVVDARFGVNSPKGYSVSIFADNLFDEAIGYYIDRQGPTFESVPTNRPRTVGINFTWDF